MGSKNITISDEAYEFLKSMKGNEMSFSDVILSMKEKRNEVMKYAGALKDTDLESIEEVRENAREDWEKR